MPTVLDEIRGASRAERIASLRQRIAVLRQKIGEYKAAKNAQQMGPEVGLADFQLLAGMKPNERPAGDQEPASQLARTAPSGPLGERFQSTPASSTSVGGVGPGAQEQAQNIEAMRRFKPNVSEKPFLPEFMREPFEDLTRHETADTMRGGLLASMVKSNDLAATTANLAKLPFSLVRGIAEQAEGFFAAIHEGRVAEAAQIATNALAGLVPGQYAIKGFQAMFGDPTAKEELRGMEWLPALDLLALGGIAGLAKWGRTAKEAAKPWEKPLSKERLAEGRTALAERQAGFQPQRIADRAATGQDRAARMNQAEWDKTLQGREQLGETIKAENASIAEAAWTEYQKSRERLGEQIAIDRVMAELSEQLGQERMRPMRQQYQQDLAQLGKKSAIANFFNRLATGATRLGKERLVPAQNIEGGGFRATPSDKGVWRAGEVRPEKSLSRPEGPTASRADIALQPELQVAKQSQPSPVRPPEPGIAARPATIGAGDALGPSKPVARPEVTSGKQVSEKIVQLPPAKGAGVVEPPKAGGAGLDGVRQKHLAELGEDQGGVQEMSGGLGAVGAGISRAVTPKARTRYTPDQVAGPDNAVRDFFDRTEKAATNPVRNLWESLKEETKKRFVPFYKLRGSKKLEYADTRNDLRLLQDSGERSMRDAIDSMRGVIGRMDKSQVDLLRRKVFVEDLLETMDKGKKIPGGLDEVNLGQEKVRLDKLMESDPDLSAAYNRHGEVWDAVRQELVDRGRLDEATAYRNYVHHDVLDFFSEHGLNPAGKLRSPKRAYLGKREGSARDILTDYLAVQYRSLSRVLRDNAVDDGLISIATRHHKDGAIPDGYVEWTPGIAIEGGKTVSGQMSARMFSRMTSELPSDIRAEVAKLIQADRPGKKIKTFNIPVELAETLDNFRGDFIAPTTGAVARATSMWKQLMLNKNALRYNRRNMLGDFERAVNAMPQAFGLEGMKEMRQTIREVIDGAKGKYSEDYKLAIENDVVGTGQVAREIGDLRQLEEFMHLADGAYKWKHPIQTVGRGLRNVSVFRENILRYHLLRTNLLRIRAGKPLLQGAADVRGMTDPIKASGKIARETLGDYGNLTAWEISQRRTLVPFYSWLKINTTFWPTLFARQGGAAVVRSGAIRGSVFIARKVAQATALYAAAQAWNDAVQSKQEAELPEYVRRRFHINTGTKNDKGEWITITDPTAFSDFMQTTGLEGIYPDTRALLRGDMSIWDFIGERAKQPVNALVQRVTPFIKAPVEATTGKQLFPDVFSPRPGEKGVKGLAEGLGFREFTSPEKTAKSYGDQFSRIGMVGGKAIDPGSSALSDTYEITRGFLKKKGYSREGVSEGPDTDKKRDLFRALSDGDVDKAKRLVAGVSKDKFREYLENRAPYHIPERGPREGMKTMNGIPNVLQGEFWASLSKEDRVRILRAQSHIAKIGKMYSGLGGR